MTINAQPLPDQKILAQAVDWLMLLQSETVTADVRLACEQWQASHPQHAAAWARVTQLQASFNQLQHNPVAKQVLANIEHPARRKALKTLGVLSVLLPGTWLGYRALPVERWRAEYQTAVGEQKSLKLQDGSRLVLNTDSAVDVHYQTHRQIMLYRGELWLETGHQDARALVVHTPHGQLVPLGTRFNVKSSAAQTILSVTEGAVRIRLENGKTSVVHAGQQQSFNQSNLGEMDTTSQSVGYWQQGMLLAQEMPLGELLTELGRYRHGLIRCHPALKSMKVSGAFPVKDTDAALDLLQKTLPVKVVSPNRFWIMVEPATNPA